MSLRAIFAKQSPVERDKLHQEEIATPPKHKGGRLATLAPGAHLPRAPVPGSAGVTCVRDL